MSTFTTRTLSLDGLDVAPAQTWGSVRLVPLIRRRVRDDLRLAARRYDEDLAVVALDGRPGDPGLRYCSFVPHGMVVSWSDDGSPVVSHGAALAKARADGKVLGTRALRLRALHRMVKREAQGRLRLLPLHLAMEGFLSLCFGGPEIAWSDYARETLAHGLSPRCERSVRGRAIEGLGEALRVFEIHERQVGVLVFVADALAAAFVVPHPDDYRALHTSLLEDFYGELLYRHGLLYPEVAPAFATLDESRVRSLADLRAGLGRLRDDWARFAEAMAAGVLGVELCVEQVYRMKPFRLERFLPDRPPGEESHIGESIVRDDGELMYLKTYRLSDAQVRRAFLLRTLSQHGWKLDEAAAALKSTRVELIKRLSNAGLGYLLAPRVLEEAQAKRAG